MVAFFIALAIYLPCCIKEFLYQLYKYAVSWDHYLRIWIDDVNEDSSDYNKGFRKRPLNDNMEFVEMKPFILHNMGIAFIVHLFIFLCYIIVKIWDCLKNAINRSFMYKFLIWMEFTLLIVGYLLVHMQAFVFSAINFRRAIFIHSYFVFCFLIAICYVAVFGLFWLYAAFRLLFCDNWLRNPINGNAFYFFIVGFRNNKMARTYDLWVLLAHFIVGMMIGLLYKEPLA